MTPEALAAYLADHIPLAGAMGVTVDRAGPDEVVLAAPLGPNINVHGTVFGGSLATLGVLAAWSVLHLRLEAEHVANQLVIHKSEMEYLAPATGRFRARATLEGVDWEGFRHLFDRRGKARLGVGAELLSDGGDVVGRFRGEFVAVRPSPR